MEKVSEAVSETVERVVEAVEESCSKPEPRDSLIALRKLTVFVFNPGS